MIYVIEQHNVGVGHFVRGCLLAGAAREVGAATLVVGGRLPFPLKSPPGVDRLDLEPIGRLELSTGRNGPLRSELSGPQADELRWRCLLERFDTRPPSVIITEFFPFSPGRMVNLLLPALRLVRKRWPQCLIFSSVRDIPISDHEPPAPRATLEILSRFYDGILSHADPKIIDFRALPQFSSLSRVSNVSTTGLICRRSTNSTSPDKLVEPNILVSSGGGRDGFATALRVLAAIRATASIDVDVRVVLGPFMPERDMAELRTICARDERLSIMEACSDLTPLVKASSLLIGQAGYNATSEAIALDRPMLLCPRRASFEQSLRAKRLKESGFAELVPRDADIAVLTKMIEHCISRPPQPQFTADTSGYTKTVELLRSIRQQSRHAESVFNS